LATEGETEGMAEAKRKLVAILAADVAGYTRLMGANERATVATLNDYRAVFRQHTDIHEGRIVDTAGDSVLAVFDSVVEAVHCAVAVQGELETRNSNLSDDLRMLFRIGVNLGDVIVQEDGTIYGDGVNVAARLEALAEPGRVCISESAFLQAVGKIDCAFEDLGEHQVKNVDRPIRAYQVAETGPDVGMDRRHVPGGRDRPTVAIMPFENRSNDVDQDYFADGMTEDITAALSKFRRITVMGRNVTANIDKGGMDPKAIGAKLGTDYMVVGSVRRSGDRLRVTTSLIDAKTGMDLWAERFDQTVGDLFSIQDEITRKMAAAIMPQLEWALVDRTLGKHQRDINAWEIQALGTWHMLQFTKSDNAEAQRLLGQAVNMAPKSAEPSAYLANTLVLASYFGWSRPRESVLRNARECAERAVALDPQNALTFNALGLVELYSGEHSAAVANLRRAVDLNPNYGNNHALLGFSLGLSGDHDAAKDHISRAIEMSPHDILLPNWFNYLATLRFLAGAEAESIEWAKKAIEANPRFPGGYRTLTAAYGVLDRLDDAHDALKNLRRLDPEISIARVSQTSYFSDPEANDRYLRGLRVAGLPE
jgi:adenylate cyclase